MQGLPPFIQHQFRAFCPLATRTSQGVPVPEGRLDKSTNAGQNGGKKAGVEEGVRNHPLPTSLVGTQTGPRVYTSVLCCSVLLCPFLCSLPFIFIIIVTVGWFLPLHSNPSSSPPEPEEVGTAGSFVGVSGLGAMYSKSQVPGP